MTKLVIVLIALLVLVSLIPGCTTSPITTSANIVSVKFVQSEKPRETAPVNSQSDMNSLVAGNNAFAFNLFQSLRDSDSNLFYSPYSISEALAMTYGGARGNTETQMANTLKFQLSQSRLHTAFNSLDLQLASRGQGANSDNQTGFILHVVNAIWGQQGFKFMSDYLDLMAQNYGAGIGLEDFINSAEQSRQNINQWVSDQTKAKIQDLLPQGSVDATTRLVLTNAIYFNAAWQHQFDPKATVDGKFTLLDGSQANAHMMNQTDSFGYASGDNYQAVELPYDGNELSMIVLLPRADQFQTFENQLNSQQVSDIINNIQYERVKLTLPKFKVESQFSLKNKLSTMGMPDAFSLNADFSGMDGQKDLHIGDVVHEAYVSVDENGTEAAAATAVIMMAGAALHEANPVQVTIDHPFIFFIRDIQTETILFIGKVVNMGE